MTLLRHRHSTIEQQAAASNNKNNYIGNTMKKHHVFYTLKIAAVAGLIAITGGVHAEDIISGNKFVKGEGTRIIEQDSPISSVTYTWTDQTDPLIIKTDRKDSPDMTDGCALHGRGEVNSTFSREQCIAEALFDLKKECTVSEVSVLFRKSQAYCRLSNVKVYASTDGIRFDLKASVSGKKAVKVETKKNGKLWRLNIALNPVTAKYVKIRAEKAARDGKQLVVCEMLIFGKTNKGK